MANEPLRRRTTCRIPGHGTGCEVAHEKADRWPRTTERRLVLEFERAASGLASDHDAGRSGPVPLYL